jgi:uncharacterized protein (DUF1778 family)
MPRKRSAPRPDDLFVPTKSDEQWAAQGWSEEPIAITAAPRLESVVSIRLDPDTAALVRRASRLCGKTRSEFVRRATINEASRVVRNHDSRPAIAVTSVRAETPLASTASVPSLTQSGKKDAVTSGASPTQKVKMGT